jgi:hypothetical protein
MDLKVDLAKYFRADRSTAVLVLSNLVTIVVALALRWRTWDVMCVYWGQSVIIGFFTCLRILDLKQFSTEGVRMNDRPLEPTRSTKWRVAGFFVLHYGSFHLVYLIFLLVFALIKPDSSIPFVGIGLCLLAFLGSHAFSFWHNRERDRSRTPNIGSVMAFPYCRVIPMHLTIIFGGFVGPDSSLALLFFLVLKTVADVVMHMVEHADRDGATLPPSDTLGRV